MIDPDILYTALLNEPGRLSSLRRLQYRCQPHRCLLLDAIDVNGHVLLHQQRYKLSPDWNAARSSAAGREKNTEDGENHWRARTYWIETSALDLTDGEGATLGLQCDHLDKQLRPSQFHAAWSGGHADVSVRPDGSLTAVR